MTDQEMEQLLREWWQESFPHAPLGKHALETHLGWGRWLLQQQGEQQQQR